jgi:hypothetical protein
MEQARTGPDSYCNNKRRLLAGRGGDCKVGRSEKIDGGGPSVIVQLPKASKQHGGEQKGDRGAERQQARFFDTTALAPWPIGSHRGPSAVGTSGNRGFPASDLDAVQEVYTPTAFLAVDRQGDLGVTGRMIDRSPQYQKLGTELRYRQDATVHIQVNPNVRGVGRRICLWCEHEHAT